MEAKELRIGNYVEVIGKGKDEYDDYFALRLINDSWVFLRGLEGTIIITELNPIPITKEWLLEFGFKIDPDFEDEFWALTLPNEYFNIEANDLDGTGFFKIQLCDLNGCLINQCEYYYVHELQNLYFALRKEELTIIEKV